MFHFRDCQLFRLLTICILLELGVQIEYDVLHLRTSLVQLFALLQLNFEEVVQIIELRRFGGAHNGYPFAALARTDGLIVRCQGPNGPGDPLGLGLGIRSSPYLGVK
jgi:hypothetical protein